MSRSSTAGLVLDAVDRYGVLLVHDGTLDCVTALVTGGPVAGSWWSHPRANDIYNALGELEDDVATVPLLRGKQTLVARRLWPDLVAVGAARSAWQLRRLGADALAVLADVDASDVPYVPGSARRTATRSLERRLLVVPTEVHTDAGHHVKALGRWDRWAAARGVVAAHDPDGARARLTDAAGTTLDDPGPLLPW